MAMGKMAREAARDVPTIAGTPRRVGMLGPDRHVLRLPPGAAYVLSWF